MAGLILYPAATVLMPLPFLQSQLVALLPSLNNLY